ncbi:hypothetical protein Tco_1009559 [Tanacetum coccineum]
MNTASTSGSGTLPGNTVTNPKEDLKGITTRSGHRRRPNPETNVSPVDTPIPKASIPFPSRRNDERRKEKANEQIEKFYEIFKDMNFEISFLDALTLMPKFASTLKTLIGNKEKLSEMAKLNETHAMPWPISVQASILCRIPCGRISLFPSLPQHA